MPKRIAVAASKTCFNPTNKNAVSVREGVMNNGVTAIAQEGRGEHLFLSFLGFLLVSLAVYSVFIPLLSWKAFSEDDSHIMRVAIDYGWLEHFFIPDVYRQLSAANYTPLSLTVYKFLLMAFGLNPIAYLVFSIFAISIVSALAGLLTEELTKSRLAAWLAMLLIFSNLSMLTLLSRFYTIHYVVGAIFALLALVLVVRGRVLLPCVLIFLALLSKEVYVALPMLIGVYAIYQRNYRLAIGAVVALLSYLTLRTYMLGFSVNVGASDSYFSGFWGIPSSIWLQFILWYAKSRYLILGGVLLASILAPARMLLLLPVALVFALPSLAVSHGIVQPQLHGDRLFLAFDVALVITAVFAIQQSGFLARYVKAVYLLPCAVVLLIIQWANQGAFRESLVMTVDYRITRYLVDNLDALQAKTVFVPLGFIQGDLMRVNTALDGAGFSLTQNCLAALDSPPDSLLVFDSQGSLATREVLQAGCVAAYPEIDIDIAPRFSDGILEWRLRASDGFAAGILFVDRALAVPVSEFARQLVMPSPGERYQVFAVKDEQWWFSDIAQMEIVH